VRGDERMIECKGLSKSFGSICAVKSLNLKTRKGEIFGLLGPNGAGKTTAIHMMCGLLTPDKGVVLLNGENVTENAKNIKKKIGFVPQITALYPNLSAIDNLKFWGSLYGIKGDVLNNKISELIALMELKGREKDKIETYSEGMKKRINIAAGILHNPDVIFMDEPTAGVDPQGRYAILEIVKSLKSQGKTIIYTTHYMEEAEKLCDKIAIIDYGEVLTEGTLKDLRNFAGEGVEVTITGLFQSQEIIKGVKDKLQFEILRSSNDSLTVLLNNNGKIGEFLTSVQNLGVELKDVKIKETDLETVFLKLTGRELRD
jgi:ABC-2 type transport system ATP-binding protein